MRCYNIQSRNMKPEFPRLCELAYRNPAHPINTKIIILDIQIIPSRTPPQKEQEKKYNT